MHGRGAAEGSHHTLRGGVALERPMPPLLNENFGQLSLLNSQCCSTGYLQQQCDRKWPAAKVCTRLSWRLDHGEILTRRASCDTWTLAGQLRGRRPTCPTAVVFPSCVPAPGSSPVMSVYSGVSPSLQSGECSLSLQERELIGAPFPAEASASRNPTPRPHAARQPPAASQNQG